jgi:hypothetical protein
MVEIAVALGLLSIVLCGVFSALTTASIASATSRETQAASEEALKKVDQYCSQTAFDSIATAVEYFDVQCKTGQVDGAGVALTTRLPAAPDSFFPRPADTANPPRPGYLTVARVAGMPDLLEIRCTVAWRSSDGLFHRVDLVTRKVR